MKILNKIGYSFYFILLTIVLLAFLLFLFKPEVYDSFFYEGDFTELVQEEQLSLYLVTDNNSDLDASNRSLAKVRGNTKDYKVNFSMINDTDPSISQVVTTLDLNIKDIKYPAVMLISKEGDLIGFYEDGVPAEYLSYLIPKVATPKGE